MSLANLGLPGVIGTFYRELELREISWVDLISKFNPDSNNASETYPFIGGPASLRAWGDGRHAKGFLDKSITLANTKYEATIDIPRDWIRRDKTGQIEDRIGSLADGAGDHWAELIGALILAGQTGECYDGSKFFAANHSVGDSGTQRNLLTKTQVPGLTVATANRPTPEEAVAAILGVIGYMHAWKDWRGKPMNARARKFIVMCSPVLSMYLAPGILNEYISGGTSNVLKKLESASGYDIRLESNPDLTSAAAFEVFRVDARQKPFLHQEEEDIIFSQKAEGSDYAHDTDHHQYGILCQRGATYGEPGYAAHATLAT